MGDDNRIEVWVKCLEPGQYFGAARPDCYIRRPDASPMTNFCKAQISIWVQMVIVIAVGVACSTIVNGPVAMLFTVAFILLGFQRDEFVKIALKQNYGGGPVESLVRMLTQRNVMTPLEPGTSTTVVQTFDEGIRWIMLAVAQVLPDFPRFNTIGFIAEGFNIPATQVIQDLVICLAYVMILFVVGYFFLRTREVAK